MPMDFRPGLPRPDARRLSEQLLDRDLATPAVDWPLGLTTGPQGRTQITFDPAFENLRPWITPTYGADLNGLDPLGFNWLLLSSSTAINLTGLLRGNAGQVIWLTNSGSYPIVLKHLATGSELSTWSVLNCGGSDFTLNAGATIPVLHNGATWLVSPGGREFRDPVTFIDTTVTFNNTVIELVNNTTIDFGTVITQSVKPPGVIYLPNSTGPGIPSWTVPSGKTPIQVVPGDGTPLKPPVVYIGLPGTSTFYPILTQPPVHNNATTRPFEIFNLPILTVAGPPTWTPAAGTYPLIISTNDKRWYWWDGSAWQVVDTFTDPMTSTGDLIYQAGGVPTRLAIGTTGQVLTVSGGGSPTWSTPSGMTNPMTTAGDIIYGGTAGAPTRLAGSGRIRPAVLVSQSAVSTPPVWAYGNWPLYISGSDVTVGNSASATSIIFTTPTLWANETDVGTSLRVSLYGFQSFDGATDTITFKILLNSTTILQSPAITTPGATTNKFWKLEAFFSTRTTGATGAIIGQGLVTFEGAGGAVSSYALTAATATTTIDFTANQVLDVTVQWSAAHVNNTITSTNVCVEQIL